MRRGEERFALTAMGRYLEMERKGSEVCFYCDKKEFEDIWETYFDLKAESALSFHSKTISQG